MRLEKFVAARNPILHNALIRTERHKTSQRWRRIGIAVVLTGILALLLALLQWLYPSAGSAPLIWMFFPSWSLWVVHALVAFQTAIVSGHVINDEHLTQRWDVLILTGISARRILIGKWLASLERVRGWLLVLGISRMALLPIYWVITLNVVRSECGTSGTICTIHEAWTLHAWILALACIIGLTLLDILCCSAIGLATSAVFRDARIAIIAAVFIRFFPLFVFLVSGFDSDDFWLWWGKSTFALVDGGVGATVQLILPITPNRVDLHPARGILMIAVALSIVLAISLAVTLGELRRQGASAHRS